MKLNPSTLAVGAAPPARGLPQAPRPRCEPPPQRARPTGFGCGSRWLNLQTSSPYNAKGHQDLFIYLGSPNFISGERKKGLESSRLGPAWRGFAQEPCVCFVFHQQAAASLLIICPPSKHAHPKNAAAHAHTDTDLGLGAAGLGLSASPCSLPRGTFMARARCAFASRAFRRGFICVCAIPQPLAFPSSGRGEGRRRFWWQASCCGPGNLPQPQKQLFSGWRLPSPEPPQAPGGWVVKWPPNNVS